MMPDGWRIWLQFIRVATEAGKSRFLDEVETLEADAGSYLALIRMIAKRKR